MKKNMLPQLISQCGSIFFFLRYDIANILIHYAYVPGLVPGASALHNRPSSSCR